MAQGAQLVVFDREACALYAEALGEHLEPDEYAVIMSRSKKDSAPRPGGVDVRRWWPSLQWERVHGRAPDEEDTDGREEPEFDEDDGFVPAGDRAAIKDFIARFKREGDPLRLLIVNAMLLTGFDAPVEQALFLDRGLRAHTLMQAIARTNRRYPGKDAGLVLDYWGVFDNLKAALAEFAAADLAGLFEDTEALITRFPGLLDQALVIVAGTANGSARRRMLRVMRHLTDNPSEAERFERLVKEAESVFETLAPDPRLAPHLPRYLELLEVYAAWRQGTRRDGAVSEELRHKTRELVQQSIGFDRLRVDLPSAAIDAGFLDALASAADLTPAEKATDIEAAVAHEITVRGEDDPLGKALAERLARLQERRARDAQLTLAGLKEWESLVSDHLAERDHVVSLGLDEVGALTHAVLRRASSCDEDEQLLAVSRAASDHWGSIAGFPGWSERPDVVKGLHKALVRELIAYPDTRPLASNQQVIADLMAALATTDHPPR